MNSHLSEAASSLMGRPQMYDDSLIKRKITCLTSGLLLCLVIGVAALGISIVLLFKFDKEGHPVSPAVPDTFNDDIAELQKQLSSIQQQIKVHEEHRQHMPVQPITGAPGVLQKSSSTPVEEERASEGEFIPVRPSDVLVSTDELGEEDLSSEEQTDTDEHTSHQQPEVPPLCDDSDLCLDTPEGSAEIDTSIGDISDDFYVEGSGLEGLEDGCMQFARPVCSEGYTICLRGDTSRCPVPVCCPEEEPKEHSSHHHH